MIYITKRRFFALSIVVILLLLCVACSADQKNEQPENPLHQDTDIQETEAFLKEFLDLEIAGDADKVCALEHFENDWESDLKHTELTSTPGLKSYVILSSERVNDAIFAFELEALTAYSDSLATFYNFVVVLDGEYRAVCNIRNIPKELFGGEDLSRFSNETPYSVDPEGVLGISDKMDASGEAIIISEVG